MRRTARSIQAGGPLVCVATLLAVLALAPVASVMAAPGGNNGTVKIHDGSAEAEPVVRNEPHVCTFHLHFLFADPAQAGGWEVREWAPAATGAVVLAGSYDTTDDGEDRQPPVGELALPDGHYKLFWEGRTDHNVKHKVFWVECPVSPLPSPSAPGPSGEVAPAQGTPGITPPPTDAAQATGTDADAGPVLLLLAGIIAGAIAMRPGRAVRRH